MKRFALFSFLASLIFFTACQNESPITGPQNNEFQKSVTAEPQWIGLPQAAGKSLAKSFATSQFVTIADGGHLVINESYISTEGVAVEAYSSIVFAPGCVQEDVTITMEIDDRTGVGTFLPHQYFNFPCILNQKFVGLNLSGVDVNSIQLYYLAEDGTFEVMPYDQLIIDVKTGTIEVINGKIPHFSLYGYGI